MVMLSFSGNILIFKAEPFPVCFVYRCGLVLILRFLLHLIQVAILLEPLHNIIVIIDNRFAPNR